MPARSNRSRPSSSPSSHRRSLRQRLLRLMGAEDSSRSDVRRGRLLLESLEKRQLMAGDVELLFTDGDAGGSLTDGGSADISQSDSQGSQGGLDFQSQSEGEAAPDLVQFALDLAAGGVEFFGSFGNEDSVTQRELFSDGQDDLPFINAFNPDGSFTQIALSNNVTEVPTWIFPDGSRLTGVQTLQAISDASGIPIPVSDTPRISPIGDLTVNIGSPLHVPIDAFDPGDGPLTTTVTVGDPSLLSASVVTGNRSLRLNVQDYGDLVFELFEQRAPRATGRVIELAESGFYDGIIFHRIIDDFVIQGGDPTGTGTGGSSLGDFDDDFDPDLQHNTEGVLSFAKAGDDTNDSQFFITEGPTRNLDFNHSVFGQLVEGFDVREAISEVPVGFNDLPIDEVVIESASIFNDTENSVVLLRPNGNATGTTTVTFTVTDSDGNTFSETVNVTVQADDANSQPFLEEITTPAAVEAGQTATLQLASIDIENDPVTYFASSTSANASVAVDASTGLVSVTPVDGFTGSVNVNVGVRPGPGVFGNGFNDQDTQLVSFTFEAASIAAPTGLDLLADSDTGASDTDNVTSAATLSFAVTGVASGQVVEIVNTATSAVVGTGIASGSEITIETNNLAALGDGTFVLAARTSDEGEVSDLSPAITVVFSSDPPESVIASAPRTANVGRLFLADLISTEEGNGLVYSLDASPAGATINSVTGEISWTPTSGQLGSNTFTLTLTDLAGNTRTESFDVVVASEAIAEVDLQLTDLVGNEIQSVAVGQEFLLNFIGIDARAINQPGIFAAYADILFNSQLIRPVPGAQIDFGDDFTVVPRGTFSDGLIDELGAASNQTVASNQRETLIATVRFEAIADGTVNIISEPADLSDSQTLLFGLDSQIPAESVAYGNATLVIGQNFTVGADAITVLEDSGSTAIDVLANDQIVSGDGQLSVISVDQPVVGGTVSLAGGSVSFIPAPDFFGTTQFTYVASDGTGTQQTGTVTVTVTAVNDPPTVNPDTFTVNQGSTGNVLDVLANDSSDPDGNETLAIVQVGTPTAGGTVTIGSDGTTVLFTPAAGFTGTDTFTYTVSDGTSTSQATVTVTVDNADDPPVAVDDAFTVTEDADQAAFDVLANDSSDADAETFTLVSVGTGTQGGTASISADGTQLLYTPAANFNGTEQFTYTIQDTGGGTAVATVTFTVTAVNDPPPASDISFPTTRGAGEQIVVQLADLTNVDAGETLTISSFDAATTAGGSVRQDTASGQLFYTPPSAEFVGSDSFTYTVADGSGLTTTATVSIEVSDFSTRTISYGLGGLRGLDPSTIRIVGTNALGQPVDLSATLSGDNLEFPDLLPGDYTIEVPAIPFLQGAEQAQSIAVSSVPDDGDLTVQSSVGRIRPEFISVRDFLRSTPAQSILVAVAPGQSSLAALPTQSATSVVQQPVVQLDQDGTNLTITGTRTTGDGDDALSENVQGSISTVDNTNVQLRGEVGGVRLYRISVDNAAVSFTTQPADGTTASAVGTNQPAGSATQPAGSATQTAATSPVVATAATSGQVSLDNSIDAASVAAASIVQADLFSPAPAPSGAIDVASDDPVSTLGDDLTEPSSIVSFADSSQGGPTLANDVALQGVSQQLTLRSTAEDQLAQASLLSEGNVDALLGGQAE